MKCGGLLWKSLWRLEYYRPLVITTLWVRGTWQLYMRMRVIPRNCKEKMIFVLESFHDQMRNETVKTFSTFSWWKHVDTLYILWHIECLCWLLSHFFFYLCHIILFILNVLKMGIKDFKNPPKHFLYILNKRQRQAYF